MHATVNPGIEKEYCTMDPITEKTTVRVPRDLLTSLFAEKLVTDRTRQNMLESRMFLDYGFPIVSDRFFLLALNILDYEPIHKDTEGGPIAVNEETIRELFVEQLPRCYHGYSFTNGGDMYVLVNWDDSEPLDKERTEKANRDFLEVCDLCRKKLLRLSGVRLQLYIGPLAVGLDKLDQRLEDLRHMMYTDMESVIIHGAPKDIITETDLNELMGRSALRDAEMLAGLEQEFYRAVMRRDFDETYRTVCRIIDIECRSFAASISLKHRLCNKIETLYSILGVPYYEPDSNVESVHQMLKNMEDTISVDDMKSQMNIVLNEFKNYFSTPVVTPSDRMNMIAEYIGKHYMDTDLCADKLCEVFDISISYLSRTFKSCIGLKLIDYIHLTKLTAAKALLESTDYTVEKIASAVGYQSVLTFNRAFKRYESMTPGVYRSRNLPTETEQP